MSNMSYCRFQNTLTDLRDCLDNIENNDLSEAEHRARMKIIKLCFKIVDCFGTIEEAEEQLKDNNDDDE